MSAAMRREPSATPIPMPALADVLREAGSLELVLESESEALVCEGCEEALIVASEDEDEDKDEDGEDDIDVEVEDFSPGCSVAVLTIATSLESNFKSAGAGAWKTSLVGASQLTFPSSSLPQQYHCWAV